MSECEYCERGLPCPLHNPAPSAAPTPQAGGMLAMEIANDLMSQNMLDVPCVTAAFVIEKTLAAQTPAPATQGTQALRERLGEAELWSRYILAGVPWEEAEKRVAFLRSQISRAALSAIPEGGTKTK